MASIIPRVLFAVALVLLTWNPSGWSYVDWALRDRAAFDAVKREAARHGVQVVESEIIGLVPEAALESTDIATLQLTGFADSQVLERRLREAH